MSGAGGAQGSGWAEAFLEMMAVERAASTNTLTAYAKDLEDAGGFLAARGRDLASASPEDVEAYVRALADRGLAAATAARRRSPAAATFSETVLCRAVSAKGSGCRSL